MQKQIISLDAGDFYGELAYGYSDKEEAIEAIEAMTGEKIADTENMEELRVMKVTDVDGTERFSWDATCGYCGNPNNGVASWATFS